MNKAVKDIGLTIAVSGACTLVGLAVTDGYQKARFEINKLIQKKKNSERKSKNKNLYIL